MALILILAGSCAGTIVALAGYLLFGLSGAGALSIWLLSGPAAVVLAAIPALFPRPDQRDRAERQPEIA